MAAAAPSRRGPGQTAQLRIDAPRPRSGRCRWRGRAWRARHVGRKSGRRYQTPVLAFPTDEGFVTPLPYGTDTDWCLNWVEAGEGAFETRGGRMAVAHPRIVSADEALPLLPAVLRPGLRLLGLPGFLVVERRVITRGQTRGARRPSRRRHR